MHGLYPYDERALSTRCTDIQMIAGCRHSAGERLPAVPGGLVLPERKGQSEQRKSEKIKEKGAARGVAGAA